MSTEETLPIDSTSSNVTEKIAETLGHNLKGGEVIELLSDVGGGKTTFVRGLARGFGSEDNVSSPTFTIKQVYEAGNKELHHFDFYRLNEAGIVGNELIEDMSQPDVVTVIEWAKIVENVLPKVHLTISFRTTGEQTRQLIFRVPSELKYLMAGL